MDAEPCESRYRASELMRALFPILLFLCCLMPLSLDAGPDAVIARQIYSHLIFGTTILADVRIDKVEKTSKKIGFYRVAVIPSVAFERVDICFRQIEGSSDPDSDDPAELDSPSTSQTE